MAKIANLIFLSIHILIRVNSICSTVGDSVILNHTCSRTVSGECLLNGFPNPDNLRSFESHLYNVCPSVITKEDTDDIQYFFVDCKKSLNDYYKKIKDPFWEALGSCHDNIEDCIPERKNHGVILKRLNESGDNNFLCYRTPSESVFFYKRAIMREKNENNSIPHYKGLDLINLNNKDLILKQIEFLNVHIDFMKKMHQKNIYNLDLRYDNILMSEDYQTISLVNFGKTSLVSDDKWSDSIYKEIYKYLIKYLKNFKT